MSIWTEQTTQEQKKQDTARLEKELNWLLDTLSEWRNRVDEIEPKVYVGELHKLVKKVDDVIVKIRLGTERVKIKRHLFNNTTED